MRVLYIEPLKKPRVLDIPLDLNSMQKLVLGPIQAIYPWEEDLIALVCNEVGMLEHLPLNRVVGHDIIHGPFFICGIGTEDFCDLPEELIAKYMDLFYAPEVFIPGPDNTLCVIKIVEEAL